MASAGMASRGRSSADRCRGHKLHAAAVEPQCRSAAHIRGLAAEEAGEAAGGFIRIGHCDHDIAQRAGAVGDA